MSTDRFTDWPVEFSRKTMTAQAAADLIRPRDTVAIPIGAITPGLAKALFARADELACVEIFACAPYLDPGWFQPGHPAFCVHLDLFTTNLARRALNEHRVDFTSIPFSRKWKALDEPHRQRSAPRVCFLSLSTPDRFGYCSYGVSMWNKAEFARRAEVVVAAGARSRRPRSRSSSGTPSQRSGALRRSLLRRSSVVSGWLLAA